MNKFQKANIAFKINAYMNQGKIWIAGDYREPTQEEAFELAKKELTADIEKDLNFVKDISLKEYLTSKQKDFKA